MSAFSPSATWTDSENYPGLRSIILALHASDEKSGIPLPRQKKPVRRDAEQACVGWIAFENDTALPDIEAHNDKIIPEPIGDNAGCARRDEDPMDSGKPLL